LSGLYLTAILGFLRKAVVMVFQLKDDGLRVQLVAATWSRCDAWPIPENLLRQGNDREQNHCLDGEADNHPESKQ